MFARDNLHNLIGEHSQNRQSTSQQEPHKVTPLLTQNPQANNHNNIRHLLVLRYPDGFVMKLSPQAARAIEALITGFSDDSFWIIARLARIRYLNSDNANNPADPLLFFQAADDLCQSKIVSPLPKHLQQKRFHHPNPLAALNQKGFLDPQFP